MNPAQRAAKIARLEAQYAALSRKWDRADGQGQPTGPITAQMQRVAALISDLRERRDEEQVSIIDLQRGLRQADFSR